MKIETITFPNSRCDDLTPKYYIIIIIYHFNMTQYKVKPILRDPKKKN